MFKDIFDLSVKRTKKEAFGFYIVYSILGALIAGLMSGFIVAIFHPNAKTFAEGARLGAFYGPLMGMLYGVFICLWIIVSKKIYNSFSAVLLTIITVPVLYFFGCIIGMIPASILTTYDSNSRPVDCEKESDDNYQG